MVLSQQATTGTKRENKQENARLLVMFSLLYGFWEYIFRKEEFRLLVVGIDNAGKTTFLEKLKPTYSALPGLDPETILPTVGLNVGRVKPTTPCSSSGISGAKQACVRSGTSIIQIRMDSSLSSTLLSPSALLKRRMHLSGLWAAEICLGPPSWCSPISRCGHAYTFACTLPVIPESILMWDC